jgi:methanogenic corrinoid protein MtbC1
LSTGTIEQLKMAVLEYDREKAASLARKAIEEGVSPIEGLAALTDAIRQVGEGYTRGELIWSVRRTQRRGLRQYL